MKTFEEQVDILRFAKLSKRVIRHRARERRRNRGFWAIDRDSNCGAGGLSISLG